MCRKVSSFNNTVKQRKAKESKEKQRIEKPKEKQKIEEEKKEQLIKFLKNNRRGTKERRRRKCIGRTVG